MRIKFIEGMPDDRGLLVRKRVPHARGDEPTLWG